ncbi:MAG: hypothetical protein LBP25_02785 [Tannerellaceae bacterium]|jgi:hypothetical protein|nr:hypothetical protein [Tannerellaceae bacterium]
MKKMFVILTVVFLTGCNRQHVEKRVYYEVTDVRLTDMGRVSSKFEFDSSLNKDSLYCRIITRSIKKNDTLSTVQAYTEDDILTVYILSSPYDFDCNTDSCMSVHEVRFTVIGINKGDYTAHLSVNNGVVHPQDAYHVSIR